jgi:hypothetical protein
LHQHRDNCRCNIANLSARGLRSINHGLAITRSDDTDTAVLLAQPQDLADNGTIALTSAAVATSHHNGIDANDIL